jgi:predicted ABC-type ATPase
MSAPVPRLRMFAGPNGSGKSTIKSLLPPALLGVYVNPDEIEHEVRCRDFLDVTAYGVRTTESEITAFFLTSTLLEKADLLNEADGLRFSDGKLSFHEVIVNAYFASVAADFLRRKLLEQRISFSFETVMSSPDKVALLETAQGLGYRTYLYYIATDDPAINVSRVQARVRLGGHDVPKDKIISRYERSLDLLLPAIRHTSRAFIFDNSRHHQEKLLIAEITESTEIETKTDSLPAWFRRAVLEKLGAAPG